MRHIVAVYLYFFKMDIRRITMYRANLISSSIGYLLESLATFFSIWLITRMTSSLGGWNSAQIFALYTYTLFLITTWEFFCVNTMEIPSLINQGRLDVFLIRPVGDLFQFLIFELDEESIFEMVTSLVILIISMVKLHLSISVFSFVLFFFNTLSALFAFEGIYLAVCASAFWFQSSDGLESIVYQIIQLSRYPITIYPNILRIAITVIPFGLYGYYPLLVLFFKTDLATILYTVLAGPVFFLLVYKLVWKNGLKHYSSAAG